MSIGPSTNLDGGLEFYENTKTLILNINSSRISERKKTLLLLVLQARPFA